jgi:hypothetical protein
VAKQASKETEESKRGVKAGQAPLAAGITGIVEMPEGYDERNEMGKVVPWKLKLIWALEPGGPDAPGVLWCGTLPGGLFRSDDRGA